VIKNLRNPDKNYSNLNGRLWQYIFYQIKKTKAAEMRAFLFYGLYFRKQSKNDRLWFDFFIL